SRNVRRKRSIGAIDVEPHSIFPTNGSKFLQRIHRPSADGTCGADYEKRLLSLLAISLDLPSQGCRIHTLLLIRIDPANCICSMPKKVRLFLNPGVRARRSVDAKPSKAFARKAGFSDVPSNFCTTSREKAYEIRHVSAANHEAATINWVPDKFGDPTN